MKPTGTVVAAPIQSRVATRPQRETSAEGVWFGAATDRLAAYFELTKPRITSLIFLVAIAGFWLGSQGAPDGRRLLETLIGIGLLASGIFALNQYLERDLDALMHRTEKRPLPAGRLRPVEALCFGVVIGVSGVAWLGLRVNSISGWVAFATLVSYLFIYTPLKKRTPHCTFIGAFPGAVPPLLGWVAARGELTFEAWVLFAIQFLWQFPHFHSIAWLYREDYARAGIRMLPVVEPEGKRMGRQIVGFTFLLVIVSAIPSFVSLSGPVYLMGALAASVAFFYFGIRTALVKSKWQARRLLLASVFYLPVLFSLMVLDKR